MPEAEVNGVRLYYELHGSGEPLVLVHGAWVDATARSFVVPGLAENFRVLSYDRRATRAANDPLGREATTRTATTSRPCWRRSTWRPRTWSQTPAVATSPCDSRPGVRTSSAHFRATSRRYGGCSTGIRRARRFSSRALAASRPWAGGSLRAITRAPRGSSSRRSPSVLARGTTSYRPRRGRSSCRTLPHRLDELQGPNPFNIEEQAISRLEMPVRLTDGSESSPIFSRVIDRLVALIPRVTRETIEGAAHSPQLTAPERYVEVTTRGVQRHAAV